MNILQGMICVMLALFLFVTERPSSARPYRHHINHKKLKAARIEAIKTEILTKLGISHIPDVSHVNTTIEYKRKMIKMYKESIADSRGSVHDLFEPEQFVAKRYHSYVDTGEPPYMVKDELWRESKQSRHFFQINISMPDNANREIYVSSAEFRIYKNHVFPYNLKDKTNFGKRVILSAYLLLTPVESEFNQPIRRLITSKVTSLLETGWEVIDIKEAVQFWIENPRKNYGLEISCDSQDMSQLLQFYTSRKTTRTPTSNEYYTKRKTTRQALLPTLSVYTHEKEILGRVKRSPIKHDCRQGDGESRCCRYPLWVSFSEIGWDNWVVAPEGYKAYYCDGVCPHRYKPAHTFAGIKSAIHVMNPAAAPAPCCTATKLRPLNLLHYDEHGQLSVSLYSDMVVQECRCA
ncbi:growth/differentiation factor 8-like [Tubulanus polymorphus]|uniref:growth/differentiation factor 8-like n=1 Tax=Tubulanus polymorphus TaxID=672921 RepID=UPI003DA64F97